MQTTCNLYAKIVKTNKNTVRVLYSFDKLSKITVVNCAYTSGDLGHITKKNMDNIITQIDKTHNFVKKAFSTNSIVGVQNCLENL